MRLKKRNVAYDRVKLNVKTACSDDAIRVFNKYRVNHVFNASEDRHMFERKATIPSTRGGASRYSEDILN